MMRSGIAFTAAGVAAAWAGPVHAQLIKADIRFGADVQHESNILRSNRLRGDFDGSDTRITPTVDIDISHKDTLDSVFLRGFLGYDFYTKNTFLNRERIRLNGGADIGLGAFCRTDLLAAIDFQQTDIADLGERVGNTSKARSFAAAVDCTRKTGLSPTISVTRLVIDNSRESRRQFDLESLQISGGVAYARPSLGVVRATYGSRRIEQPNRIIPGTGIGIETTVQEFGLRITRAVAPRIAFDAQLLWLKTSARRQQATSFSGLGWNTSVRWIPFPRLAMTGESNRTVAGESTFGASYSVQTRNTFNARYRIGHRTSATLSVTQQRRVFRGEIPNPVIGLRGWDSTWAFSAGLGYDLFRNTRVNASAAYRKRNSGNDFFDYSSTGAQVGARVRF